MSAPMYYQLLGHVLVAAHTAHDYEDIAGDLQKAGFGESKVEAGLELARRGEELIEEKLHLSPDDKNMEHTIHSATTEVEMWMQTVKFRVRKAGFDAEFVDDVLGHDIHGDKHTVTAIAQSLRAIAMLRTLDEGARASLGSDQSVRDLIIRGNTLLKKLYKNAAYIVVPSSMAPRSMDIFGKLDAQIGEMMSWLADLEDATRKIEDLESLGMLGYVPHDIGLPVGGTSFGVVRHERAQRAAPSSVEAITTSGWSVGRQGNSENLGKGWVQPTYDVNQK